MSGTHTWVKWNKAKLAYDAVVLAGIVAFIAVFIAVGIATPAGGNAHDPMILLIRATAFAAITLLHVVLCIGPLVRLWPAAAPLLYNRRHLGVTTFVVSLAHAALVLLYYGGFGAQSPGEAVIAAPVAGSGPGGFPFEALGFGGLVLLFVLAATSHDFWNFALGPRLWKALHMLVYAAYALVIAHVALGALQSERDGLHVMLLGAGVAFVGGLHIAAGLREARRARGAVSPEPDTDGWIDAGLADDIPLDGARTLPTPRGERIAVFRFREGGDERVGAMSNACAHQGGPLGEGRVIDGCLTCPWHGWQYEPETGHSPPPYAERVPTHEVRVEGRRVFVRSTPRQTDQPAGCARIGGDHG
ncbi:MAG: Rieske 2Fe-2S domain-containing protein [Planctomycetota bacterium]